MPSGTVNGNGESIVMDYTTHNVHSGKVRGFYNEDIDLDTGEILDTLIVVGANPIHIVLDLTAFGGQVIAEIYEGATVSLNGTPLRASRFNRLLNVPIDYQVYTGPTVVNPGDLFVKRRVLAYAQGSSAITSQVKGAIERVFKPFTNYLIRQTAVSDNISLTLVGIVYEE